MTYKRYDYTEVEFEYFIISNACCELQNEFYHDKATKDV